MFKLHIEVGPNATRAIVADAPDCTAAAAFQLAPAEVEALIEYLADWLGEHHDGG